MFHLIQYVETHEYIGIIRQGFGIQFLHHFPIHHAFVGDTLCLQDVPEILINVAQYIPHGDEFFLQCRPFLDGEILEELLDGCFLFLVHEGIVVHHGTELLQVLEELVGRNEVLVGIVEIAQ